MALVHDTLRASVWEEAGMDVLLRGAAADPGAQRNSVELRQQGFTFAAHDKRIYRHRLEVLIRRAIGRFCELDAASQEILREQPARLYGARVKRCYVRHDGLTEILHRDGLVKLFDSHGRRVANPTDSD